MPTHNIIRDPDGTIAKVEARTQNPTGNALNVQIGPGDPISNIPVVMDFEHHQVHEGEAYLAIEQRVTIGTGTTKYGLLVPVVAVPLNGPHMVVGASVYNGAVRVDIYEAATWSGGSALTSVKNRNRNSANNPVLGITSGITSANGTLIDSFYVGAGNRSSGGARSNSEWILKSNTAYRVDFIGQVAGTAAVITFDWYEDLGV